MWVGAGLALASFSVGGVIADVSTTASAAAVPLVTSPSGGVAAGARVVEIAWPREAVEKTGGKTGPVPVIVLARTTTDSRGRYTLPAVPLATLQRLANPDGTVNVQTSVLGDGFEGLSSRPVSVAALANASAHRADGKVLLPAATVRTFKVATTIGSRSGVDAIPMDNATTCSTRRVKTYGKRPTIAGSTWSTTRYAKQTFTYGKGGSSSLGVGVSGSGTYGSYHVGGTHSSTSSYVEQYPRHSGASRIHERTYVVPAKYRQDCHMSLPPTDWHTYFVQSRYIAGGQSEAKLSPKWLPRATHCVPESKGGHTYVTSSTAATHSAGFVVAPLIGMNLSARSGWSKQVRLTIDWSGPARLCGTRSDPGRPRAHGELVARGR